MEHEVRRLLSGGCELWELVMTVCALLPCVAHHCCLCVAEPAIVVPTSFDHGVLLARAACGVSPGRRSLPPLRVGACTLHLHRL